MEKILRLIKLLSSNNHEAHEELEEKYRDARGVLCDLRVLRGNRFFLISSLKS